MWTELKGAWRDAGRLATTLPLLMLVPVAAEFAQHVVEIQSGMYASLAAMEAASDDGARLGFGLAKILSLLLLFYWTSRALAGRRPIIGDGMSLRLFLPVMLLELAATVPQLFGGSLLAPLVPDARAMFALGLIYVIAVQALATFLLAWRVGAALGEPRLTIPASFRIMQGHFWWSLGYTLAAALPLMAVHYALAVGAIGRGPATMWTLLAVDSLVVGLLGLSMGAAAYRAARRAVARAAPNSNFALR